MRQEADKPVLSRITGLERATRPLLVCIHGGGCNGNYFDLPGFSFRVRAEAQGFPVLLIDRPGHGLSPTSGQRDFRTCATAILDHVTDVIASLRLPAEWFVVGHSIGAAVAVILAGALRPRDLHGMAISGIGDRPTSAALEWRQKGDVDAALSALLFGSQGSFSWRGPKALRHAAEPWSAAEVAQTLHGWPTEFPRYAEQVRVPVHLRLADEERIWETGEATIARLSALFSQAPSLDAELLPEGGHLYEVHHRGHELMESQLGFFNRLTASLDYRPLSGIAPRS